MAYAALIDRLARGGRPLASLAVEPPSASLVVGETVTLVARMLECFERRTGLPVVVNTSLNTAGRPMVDDPRDALECFGSTPVDLLARTVAEYNAAVRPGAGLSCRPGAAASSSGV